MNNSFLSSIVRSCTDFKFYKQIFKQPFGRTLRYLLFLSILSTVLIGVRYTAAMNKFIQKNIAWIEQNAPELEIIEGEVKTQVQQPYIAEEKDFVLIVDTTDNTKDIDKKYKAGILVTKNKMIIKTEDDRIQDFDLKKIKQFTLNKDTLQKMRKFLIFVLIPFVFLMQFVSFFAAKIIQSLVAGALIIIVRPGQRLSNMMNICIYAVTPPTVLALIVMLMIPRPIPLFSLIYIGMYAAFIIGAVNQCLAQQETQTA